MEPLCHVAALGRGHPFLAAPPAPRPALGANAAYQVAEDDRLSREGGRSSTVNARWFDGVAPTSQPVSLLNNAQIELPGIPAELNVGPANGVRDT